MSNEAGGSGMAGPQPGYPPPGYPPPGYPPPGYGPPPGYAQPGYGPPGYPPPGYGPPGYGAQPYGAPYLPPALKPGVIPLRPLSLSDIFNGAVAYIRANPKATLGITTIVVVATQVLVLILSVSVALIISVVLGPDIGPMETTADGEEVSLLGILTFSISSIFGPVALGLASIPLSGLLTAVIGRAVFGAGITIGEAWQRLKGRMWALLGYTVLYAVGGLLLAGIVVGLIIWVAAAANAAAATVIGIPLVLGGIAAAVYLGTKLTFTPSIIVLERLDIFAAIERSFKLVKHDFWRVFGIFLLATIVASLVASAVAIPFNVGGQVLLMAGATSTLLTMLALILISAGSAIGQIIISPFSAGVVVLLYADRRIRAEAFDMVLQTGAAYGPGTPPDSTDHLWLTRQT